MQENEFEKQLKDMMDEFKLVPSASVWEKVSRRLNEGRRKKRPFIFLLFWV
jgi:adenylate kinase family enzyme